MAINLQSTSGVNAENLKILVYGQAGAGKTSLIPTLPNPIILSAEGGLLSINDHELPFIEIKSIADLRESYEWLLNSDESKQFESVAIDSVSEIAEVCLAHEKRTNKDPRAAYGEMQSTVAEIIRCFRDLPDKHIYMTAKLEKSQDEMGRMLYAPSMPGKNATQAMPYYFDLVAALRVEKDADGVAQRALMCDTDGLWQAKDRSGKLDMWEAPDLGAIIKKAGGK
jgi:phage nucleotide-binding protein